MCGGPKTSFALWALKTRTHNNDWPEVQKPSCNFHKPWFVLTRIIWQLYTSKSIKSTKLDYRISPDKLGCN